MNNFVRKRDQGGGPTNSKRLALGANAKVGPTERPNAHQSQGPLTLPSRGIGHAQNSSAVMQQHPGQRQSGQGYEFKRDAYDTDAESIDTTANQSVIQPNKMPTEDFQNLQHGQVDEFGEVSEFDEEDEEGEEELSDNDYVFTQDDVQLFEGAGLQDLPRDQQLDFLRRARPRSFGTIDGDSYPTTTDGNPTEWEGRQEPPDQNPDNRVSRSSLLQRPTFQSVPQPLQRDQRPEMFKPTQASHKSSNLVQQSANLRAQQRVVLGPSQRELQSMSYHTAGLPSSQPPTYSQMKPANVPQYLAHNGAHEQENKPLNNVQGQPSGPKRVQLLAPRIPETTAATERPSSVRTNVRPLLQQQPLGEVPVEGSDAAPDGDYHGDVLYAMTYDQLKKQDFDIDPRAEPHVLSDDIREKPLVNRLEYVQQNFQPEKQAKFFSSLPTTEWEDAGDWFLDQFQDIIRRTREARQRKRKLAQEFEDEVEERHKHIAKKQQQVQEAMDKMKAQGEGLVPKSPKPSRSSKPKKG